MFFGVRKVINIWSQRKGYVISNCRLWACRLYGWNINQHHYLVGTWDKCSEHSISLLGYCVEWASVPTVQLSLQSWKRQLKRRWNYGLSRPGMLAWLITSDSIKYPSELQFSPSECWEIKLMCKLCVQGIPSSSPFIGKPGCGTSMVVVMVTDAHHYIKSTVWLILLNEFLELIFHMVHVWTAGDKVIYH